MAQCPECRWITLKPHGPDHPDYRHVLIRPTSTGFRVVWAGDASLMHLRVNPEGGTGKRRGEVDPKKREELRQRWHEEWQSAVATHLKTVGSMLGYSDDELTPELADELLRKLGFVKRVAPRTDKASSARSASSASGASPAEDASSAPSSAGPSAQETNVADAGKPSPDGAEPPDTEPAFQDDVKKKTEALLARAERQPSLDKAAKQILNEYLDGMVIELDPEVRDDLHERIRSLDADRAEALLLSMIAFEKTKRRYTRRLRDAAEPEVSESLLRGAEAVEADVLKERALEDARQRVYAKQNIEFWKQFDSAGAGVTRRYLQGAQETALAMLSDAIGNVEVNPAIVNLLGVEGSAQLFARVLVEELGESGATDLMTAYAEKHAQSATTLPEQVQAMLQDSARNAELIESLRANGTLSAQMAGRELARETLYRQRVLGQAAGSLAFSAALIDHLRRKSYAQPIQLTGSGDIQTLRRVARYFGLEKSDYKLVDKDGRLSFRLQESGYEKIRQTLRVRPMPSETEIEAPLPEDWQPPGMITPEVRLDQAQRDAIAFAESRKNVVWDLKAGIGKSLASLSLASKLLEDGKVDRVFLLVPANLRDSMVDEVEKFFGTSLDVSVAGEVASSRRGKVKRVAVGQKERHALIRDADAKIVIIGHETLRNDHEAIAEAIQNAGGRVLIVADEAHKTFSPGEGNSQVMQAMYAIRKACNQNSYTVAMTGTPIRTSATDLARIARWANPDAVPSDRIFEAKYGGLSYGANAHDDLIEKAFRRAVSPIVLTRGYTVEAKRHEIPIELDLSDQQQKWYQEAESEPHANVREYARYRAVYNRAPSGNALVQKIWEIVEQESARETHGLPNRGLVHLNYLPGAETIRDAFPRGSVLLYTGEVSQRERARIRDAFNHDKIIEGIRISWRESDGSDARKEGVVVEVRSKQGQEVYVVEDDDGQRHTVDSSHEPRSELKLIVATAAGSTGLNLQRGGRYIIHHEPPYTASERQQRDARIHRKGQPLDVNIYDLRPNLPQVRRHLRKLDQQSRLMARLTPNIDETGTLMRNATT